MSNYREAMEIFKKLSPENQINLLKWAHFAYAAECAGIKCMDSSPEAPELPDTSLNEQA